MAPATFKIFVILLAVVFMAACTGESNPQPLYTSEVKGEFATRMTPIEPVKDITCWKNKNAPTPGDQVRLLASDYQPGKYNELYNLTTGSIITLNPYSGPYGRVLLGTGSAKHAAYATMLDWRGVNQDMKLLVMEVNCIGEAQLPNVTLVYDIKNYCQDKPRLSDLSTQRPLNEYLRLQMGISACAD
jgi:hypothetical protein